MAESGVKSWLQLLRAAALPTALADVWLGAGIVEQLPTKNALVLSAVSLLLYGGGMVLNDLADIELDRRENPDRPLPSGKIRPALAGICGFLMLGAAIFLAYFSSIQPWPLYVASAIALLVLTYDFNFKARKYLGALNMGVCRGLNVLLGVSLIPLAFLGPDKLYLLAALPIFLYVTGVTILSGRETDTSAKVAARDLVLPIAAILIVPLFTFFELKRLPHILPEFAKPIIAGVLIISAVASIGMLLRLSGKPVRESVGRLLVGIIPLQAFVAIGHFRPGTAVAIIVLVLPAWFLRRFSKIT